MMRFAKKLLYILGMISLLALATGAVQNSPPVESLVTMAAPE